MDDLASLDFGGSKQGKDTKNPAPSSYNFDALLRSMPSAQDNSTPNRSGSSTPRVPRPNSVTKSSSSKGNDAFSSLLPTSFQEENSTGSARLSTLQNGSGVKLTDTNTDPKPKSAAAVTSGTTSGKAQYNTADIWEFDTFEQHTSQKTTSRPNATSSSMVNNWNLLDDASHTKSQTTSSQTQSSHSMATSLLDDSEQGQGISTPPTNVSMSSSSVDLLDDFFSPAPSSASSKPNHTRTAPASKPPKSALSNTSQTLLRTHSPPPHVVGVLVEMGFAPKAARQALAQTASGVEIEAALTILTKEQESNGMRTETHTGRDEPKPKRTQQNAPPKRNEQSRTSMPPPTMSSRPNHAQDADWQKHADQLRSQATEFGSSMLKSANAFWGSAKAQAQRALDEARTDRDGSAVDMAADLGRHAWRRWGSSMQANRNKPLNYDGRPRWMQDAEHHRNQAQESGDDRDQQVAGEPRRETDLASHEKPTLRSSEPEILTFSDESSSHTAQAQPQSDILSKKNDMRTKGLTTANPSQPIQRAKPTMAKSTKQPANDAGKAAMLQRSMPNEDPSSVERAQKLKAEGNAAFQRGSYAEAEQKYSQALDVLCKSSLYRIPLLNNRANVRSKNGDSQGTCSDCTACLSLLILPGMQNANGTPIYRPNQENPLPASYQINLREAYAKCISQRARAYEVREQWSCALQDWIALQTYERTEGSGSRLGAANRRAASDGLIRCEKMLRPSTSSESKTVNRAANSSKAPTSKINAAAERASDAGRDRVRKQMQAQDAEDAERLQHKDAVEARLDAWMNGKKGNVRALLSSVDDPQYNLIWPNLGWKKVHLHELLTDAQVKRAYTRAIAKLHPDKLKRDSTSVEQRMLATGVFHALNEAFHT